MGGPGDLRCAVRATAPRESRRNCYRRDRGRGRGGILLSAAYILTRRLWLAIGLHFGWDFSQDAIFGVGKGTKGLVEGDVSGPALLSGGSAGVEGSIVALVLCLGVGAYLLVRAGRQGKLTENVTSRHLGE